MFFMFRNTKVTEFDALTEKIKKENIWTDKEPTIKAPANIANK